MEGRDRPRENVELICSQPDFSPISRSPSAPVMPRANTGANMKRGLCIVAVCAPMLGGCLSWSVDESWFFQPYKRAEKATTASELKLDAEERLTRPGPFSRDFGRVFPNFPDRIPARIEHDFISLGGERIAITRIAGANATSDEPLIVYCGGQSGDRRSNGTVYAGKLLPWGEALLIDYPGYGDSSGEPTVAAMLAFQGSLPAYIDALAVDRPLILWGHSLGGPICAAVASKSTQVDAVILETTAPSFADIMDVRKPWFTPPTVQLELVEGLKTYDVPAALAGFSGPIMVLGADKDQVFPVELERSVADKLKKRGLAVTYLEYEAADHLNSALNGFFVRDAAGFFANLTNSRH